MIPDEKSTVRSRELGDALRLAMERANVSGKYAARVLAWSETKVSRLLTGRRTVRESEVASLLTLCRVNGAEYDSLLSLAREASQQGCLQGGLPDQLRTLINHENRATEITEFQPNFVPGLLQTHGYAEALLARSVLVPPERLPEAVQARENRKNIFSRTNPPQFTFYLHEVIFHIPVGGSDVMSTQMHHLLQMSVRRYITIQVIPAAFGAHASVTGACRLMEFDEFGSVAYIEQEASGLFLETPAEVETYQRIFAALANCALGVRESQDRIAELAVRLYAE
jgi:hypothetical protein